MKRIRIARLAAAGFPTANRAGFAAPQPPDDTRENRKDRAAGSVTADRQKDNPAGRELAERIRRAVLDDNSRSRYAHNVKVIRRRGNVTLQGPAHNEQEQASIASAAAEIAGPDNAVNEIPARAARSQAAPASSELVEKQENSFMAGKNKAVFGIYKTREDAERAVRALLNAGFSAADISMLLPGNQGPGEVAHQKGTQAPEGAATGAAAGGAVGGTLGLLAGIGALAIPGVGPLIAAGPIVATLAGAGAGGARGGLVGGLAGLGIPEYEAKRYEGRVKRGGLLLCVHGDTSEEIGRANGILKNTGAEDVASAGEKAASAKAAR